MKKIRIVLTLALVMILSLSMTFSVHAQDLTEFLESYSVIAEEEQRRIDEIKQSENSDAWLGVVVENLPLNTGVSFYPTCTNCYNFSVSVCAGEATLVDQGYHKGGFLGLFDTDCYAYYYASRGAEMCPYCATVLWIYEGQHNCLEDHMKCSKGKYSTCPMDVS